MGAAGTAGVQSRHCGKVPRTPRARGLAAASINQRISALLKLAKEPTRNGLLDAEAALGIRDVQGVRFERSDDFRFANDLVTFRVLLRTDSKQILNGASGAVKFYRNSAT